MHLTRATVLYCTSKLPYLGWDERRWWLLGGTFARARALDAADSDVTVASTRYARTRKIPVREGDAGLNAARNIDEGALRGRDDGSCRGA